VAEERIPTVKSPIDVVVGREYDVPSLLTRQYGWIPVLMPIHQDGPEFCFNLNPMHGHIDWRFLRPEVVEEGIDVYLPSRDMKPRMRRWTAIQGETIGGNNWVFAVERMHRRFQNTTLKQRICPHQGVPLVNCSGVCPAHGLAWNFKSGKLRYKLPFFLMAPDGSKGEIKNSKCEIQVTDAFSAPCDFQLVDANGEVYPNAVFSLAGSMRGGGTVHINDKNCGKT
jgi:hypothetical protein